MPPLFYVVLRNSVQERGLWCTELTFGAKSGLLVYARRFQRHSVQKTGIYGTEGKFGAKKRLLVYGGDIRYRREPPAAPDAASKAQKQPPAAPNASSVRGTVSARRRANIKEGDQKVFCSPSYGLPNPRRLTSATPIRGISRLRCGPFGTFGSPLLIYGMFFTLRPIRP